PASWPRNLTATVPGASKRPHVAPSEPSLCPEVVPMLPRVEYSVTAPTTPEQLWDAFCDLTRLLHRGLYSDASWTEGTPWQLGSRLRYVVVKPVAAVVSSVVTFVD